MPRKPRPWFRLYVEIIHDRKIRRMPVAHRWLWVVVLATARQSPEPGVLLLTDYTAVEVDDLVDLAALNKKEVRSGMASFEESEMIVKRGECWAVTQWNTRQFEVDNTTERTRKHRSNEQGRNVPTSSVGTDPLCSQKSEVQRTEIQSAEPPYVSRQETVVCESPDDDERMIAAAVEILALQDLANREAETGEEVENRAGWLVTARKTQRLANGERIRSLRIPNRHWSAEELARAVEAPRHEASAS